VEVSYKIPVIVENVPANMQVEAVDPPAVNATFAGPRRAFYLFDANTVKITVDASLAELGRRTFNISEQNVRGQPRDMRLQDITPPMVRLSVRKTAKAEQTTRG
jgi:hypothetical protein